MMECDINDNDFQLTTYEQKDASHQELEHTGAVNDPSHSSQSGEKEPNT